MLATTKDDRTFHRTLIRESLSSSIKHSHLRQPVLFSFTNWFYHRLLLLALFGVGWGQAGVCAEGNPVAVLGCQVLIDYLRQ